MPAFGYPADLRPPPEPEYGDGCRFVLADEQTTRTGYVLPGRLGNRILCRKTVLKVPMLTTFAWTYSAAGKAAMDAVIQHTISNLQLGGTGAG